MSELSETIKLDKYHLLGMAIVQLVALSPIWVAVYFALMAQVSNAVADEVDGAAKEIAVYTGTLVAQEVRHSQLQIDALTSSISDLKYEIRALRVERQATLFPIP